MLPEALDIACRRFKPRAVCLTPTQLNPTGATMNEERRDAVAEVLERHGVWLIEDDVHALLEPPGLTPLTARVPHLLSRHQPDQGGGAGAASRISQRAPGAAAPHPAPHARHHLDGHATDLRDRRRWIADDTLESLAREQRELLAERQRLATRLLSGHEHTARPTSLHVWLALPTAWRTEELQQQAEQEGVAITTAVPFMVEQTAAPRRVRLSVGAEPDIERFEEGLQRLVTLLDEAPPPMMQFVY